MRKYAVRFLLIAVLIVILLDINRNPETNYTTQIESTVTGQTFDIREAIQKASLELEKLKCTAIEYTKEILSLFGFDSEEGE